jgi:hypothetical protein
MFILYAYKLFLKFSSEYIHPNYLFYCFECYHRVCPNLSSAPCKYNLQDHRVLYWKKLHENKGKYKIIKMSYLLTCDRRCAWIKCAAWMARSVYSLTLRPLPALASPEIISPFQEHRI